MVTPNKAQQRLWLALSTDGSAHNKAFTPQQQSWWNTVKNSSYLFKKFLYPGTAECRRLRVLKWFSASCRLSAIQEGTVLYGLQGLDQSTGRVFLGIILCKGIEWNSGECPSPFPPELSPWNPFQQPCHGSVWDRPRGEGWGTSSVQWDCQPRTKSIQMISLDNNLTSKDPSRCPQKDNSC